MPSRPKPARKQPRVAVRSARVDPPRTVTLQTSLSRAQCQTLCNFAMLVQHAACMFIPRSAPGMGEERLEIPCDCLKEFERRLPRLAFPLLRTAGPLCRAVLAVIRWAIPRVAQELTAAGVPRVPGKRCFASVMLVKPGASPQDVHRDMAFAGKLGYYTVCIPATAHAGQGTTEYGQGEPFSTLEGTYGHRGDVPHRGGMNSSEHPRVFLALIFSDGMDPNRIGYPRVASFGCM